VTPNPGFKVTGYLKVEYLADGALVQKCNVSNRPTIETHKANSLTVSL